MGNATQRKLGIDNALSEIEKKLLLLFSVSVIGLKFRSNSHGVGSVNVTH